MTQGPTTNNSILAKDRRIIVECRIYLTRSLSGPLCCANSFFEALEFAYKLTARTSSPLLVPCEIECLNTGQRFDYTKTVPWWDCFGRGNDRRASIAASEGFDALDLKDAKVPLAELA